MNGRQLVETYQTSLNDRVWVSKPAAQASFAQMLAFAVGKVLLNTGPWFRYGFDAEIEPVVDRQFQSKSIT